eukprot:1157702-Pelagomonas_calceolata.AAC.1
MEPSLCRSGLGLCPEGRLQLRGHGVQCAALLMQADGKASRSGKGLKSQQQGCKVEPDPPGPG